MSRSVLIRVLSILVLVLLVLDGSGGRSMAQQAESSQEDQYNIVPAPAGFIDQVKAIYSREYAIALKAAQISGQNTVGSQLLTPPEMSSRLDAVKQSDVDIFYAVASHTSGWDQLPAALDTIDRAMSSDEGSAAPVGRSSLRATIQPPPPPPEVEVEAAKIDDCSPVMPERQFRDDEILALELTIIVLRTVMNGLPAALEFFGVHVPFPLKGIIGLVVAGFEVAVTGIKYAHDVYFFCIRGNTTKVAEETDKISRELWEFSEYVREAADALNENVLFLRERMIDTQRTTDELLTSEIQQALVAPIGAPANLAYQLPDSEGGYLNAKPIGVRSIVRGAYDAARSAGVVLGQAAPNYLASAEEALAGHRYTKAYEMYQRAYQEVGQ